MTKLYHTPNSFGEEPSLGTHSEWHEAFPETPAETLLERPEIQAGLQAADELIAGRFQELNGEGNNFRLLGKGVAEDGTFIAAASYHEDITDEKVQHFSQLPEDEQAAMLAVGSRKPDLKYVVYAFSLNETLEPDFSEKLEPRKLSYASTTGRGTGVTFKLSRPDLLAAREKGRPIVPEMYSDTLSISFEDGSAVFAQAGNPGDRSLQRVLSPEDAAAGVARRAARKSVKYKQETRQLERALDRIAARPVRDPAEAAKRSELRQRISEIYDAIEADEDQLEAKPAHMQDSVKAEYMARRMDEVWQAGADSSVGEMQAVAEEASQAYDSDPTVQYVAPRQPSGFKKLMTRRSHKRNA